MTKAEAEKLYGKYVELRDSKGVKDVDIADATGIRRSCFSDWKGNRSAPDVTKLIKIASFFGMTVEEFLKGVII